MELNQKENVVMNRTIQYLANRSLIAPKFLGEFNSNEEIKQDWLEKDYFAWWLVGESKTFCSAMHKLDILVKAVSVATESKLNKEENKRVVEGVSHIVERSHNEFISSYGDENFYTLMNGEKIQ